MQTKANFFISAFFKAREQSRKILDQEIDGIEKVVNEERYMTKCSDHYEDQFVETSVFATNLPLLSLFCIRAPVSKLMLSPDVNHRKVNIDSFSKVPESQAFPKSIKECVESENDAVFNNRNMGIYPYQLLKDPKILTKGSNKAVDGVPLESISS